MGSILLSKNSWTPETIGFRPRRRNRFNWLRPRLGLPQTLEHRVLRARRRLRLPPQPLPALPDRGLLEPTRAPLLPRLSRKRRRKGRRGVSDRNILSLTPISVRGRLDLPVSTSKVDRDRATSHLVRAIGIRATPMPVDPPTPGNLVTFEVPGSSRVKGAMRSKSFAYGYLRQTLAVALTESEQRDLRAGTRLSHTGVRIKGTGLAWYLISGRRLNLRFARWCVTHWQRTFGLDPRPPRLVIKLPTLDFLECYALGTSFLNYSGRNVVGNRRRQVKPERLLAKPSNGTTLDDPELRSLVKSFPRIPREGCSPS